MKMTQSESLVSHNLCFVKARTSDEGSCDKKGPSSQFSYVYEVNQSDFSSSGCFSEII